MGDAGGAREGYLRRFRYTHLRFGPSFVAFRTSSLADARQSVLHDRVYDLSILLHVWNLELWQGEPVTEEWRYQTVSQAGPSLLRISLSLLLSSPLLSPRGSLLAFKNSVLSSPDTFYTDYACKGPRSSLRLLHCTVRGEYQWCRLLPHPPCGDRHLLR